jgi:hypothetical protein
VSGATIKELDRALCATSPCRFLVAARTDEQVR